MKKLFSTLIMLTSVSAQAVPCDVFVKAEHVDAYGSQTSEKFLGMVKNDLTLKGFHVVDAASSKALTVTVHAVSWYVTKVCQGAAIADIEIRNSKDVLLNAFAESSSCQGWLFAKRTLKNALKQIPNSPKDCKLY